MGTMDVKLTVLLGVGAMAVSTLAAVAIVKATTERDPRIDELTNHLGLLEARVEALEDQARRALSAREPAAPLASVWWCWMARCERSAPACRASIEMAVVQSTERHNPTLTENLMKLKCEVSDVAYCASDGTCFGTMAFCEGAGRGTCGERR